MARVCRRFDRLPSWIRELSNAALTPISRSGCDCPIVYNGSIVGVYGTFEVNYHLAQIYIPELEWLIYGRFPGVHLASGGQRHSALLGRNFLQQFTLIYEGHSGVATISNDWA